MGTAFEGLSGPVRKAASDLLGKQASAAASVTAGGGRAMPPTSAAAEPPMPSKISHTDQFRWQQKQE